MVKKVFEIVSLFLYLACLKKIEKLSVSRLLQGCPSGCSVCTNPNICTSCLPGHGITTSGTCEECGDGKYKNGEFCKRILFLLLVI